MNENRKIKNLMQKLALPLYLLTLLGLDLLFRWTYGFVGGVSWTDKTALTFTALWILFLGAAVWLLPRLGGRIFILATTVLSCLLVAVHAIMYHLFGNFFGFSDLLYAGDGAAFFSLEYLHMRKLLLTGILLALAAGILAAVFLPKQPYHRARVLSGLLAMAVSVGGLCWINARLTVELKAEETMGWSVAMKEEEQVGSPAQILYSEFKNPNVCLPMTGLYQYTFRDMSKTFFSQASQDKARALEGLDAWFESRPAPSVNAHTGVLAGKNLIMIMVESLDTWMLTEDYMPNLWALKQESVDLVHHYTPLYLNAGTFATEFTSMTGVAPPISGVSTNAYVENSLPASLPRLFAREGYTVNSFHSASPMIYNRGAIHENLGFEAYHSFREMGMEDYMLDSQMLNGFNGMISRNQPFFSFLITYSGHGPYNEEQANIAAPHLERARVLTASRKLEAPADTLEQYTRAIAHIMETDDFIGGLVERLEDAGLLNDTVLIIYGDHYGKYITDTDFLMTLKGAENRNLLCSTPMLIWSRNLASESVEKYTSTVDIFPTVCSLFGLDADLRYFVGDDVFSDAGGLVYWRDGSSYDGTTYIDGTQAALLNPEQRKIYELVRQKLEVSWRTFQYDYFAGKEPIVAP